MKRENAGKVILGGMAAVLLLAFAAGLAAEDLAPIKLNPPSLKRGLPLMEALAVRASVREFADRDLSLQDLSDLLWAADGITRPAENKSTAPSAMNAHDVRIIVFMRTGAYMYEQQKHELLPLLAGDLRAQVVMARPPRPAVPPAPGTPNAPPAPPAPPPPVAAPATAPVEIILISDGDRFRHGGPEQKAVWGALDAGIVSQNISLFCAATGLKTCPKASVNKEKIKELLKLTDAQVIFLDHPVGYAK